MAARSPSIGKDLDMAGISVTRSTSFNKETGGGGDGGGGGGSGGGGGGGGGRPGGEGGAGGGAAGSQGVATKPRRKRAMERKQSLVPEEDKNEHVKVHLMPPRVAALVFCVCTTPPPRHPNIPPLQHHAGHLRRYSFDRQSQHQGAA